MPKHAKTKVLPAQQLATYLGLTFQSDALLLRALTHCSYSSMHMERLEFLGDAVLGVVIAEYLHDLFPHEAEGQLSRLRAGLVRKESLYEVALLWNLQLYLRVGEGERSAHGIKSSSIVANAVEAVIGASFKDAGWDVAKSLILKAWQPLLANMGSTDARDAKSRLQEYTQAKSWGLPDYKVHDLGVDKEPRFKAICSVKDKVYGTGLGVRKKVAELNAAEQAMRALQGKVKA